jgi:hypothetical protein
VIGVLAASVYLAAAGLVVLGEGHQGCPDAGRVSARLAQLLGEEPGAEAPDALVIDGEPGALRVRLLSAQGTVREEKTLDLQGSCDELADAVATVAVAWRSQLQADEVPPPVLAARLRAVDDGAPAPPRRPAPTQADLELALGLQAVSGSARWAPTVLLAAQAPVGRGYSVAFTLNVPAPRAVRDPTGKQWRWMELSAVVAPSLRLVTEPLLVDTQLGLGTGVNVTTSESLRAAGSYRLVPPTLVAAMRVTYPYARGLPWFGVTFSTRVLHTRDSPIHNADLSPEPWWLGLALGGTLAFDQGR